MISWAGRTEPASATKAAGTLYEVNVQVSAGVARRWIVTLCSVCTTALSRMDASDGSMQSNPCQFRRDQVTLITRVTPYAMAGHIVNTTVLAVFIPVSGRFCLPPSWPDCAHLKAVVANDRVDGTAVLTTPSSERASTSNVAPSAGPACVWPWAPVPRPASHLGRLIRKSFLGRWTPRRPNSRPPREPPRRRALPSLARNAPLLAGCHRAESSGQRNGNG
jgi:hypothetical protein